MLKYDLLSYVCIKNNKGVMINTTVSGRGVKIHRYESVTFFNVKDATTLICGLLH